MNSSDADEVYRQKIALGATDAVLVRQRIETLKFLAKAFSETGKELHVAGHILGDDRKNGNSPFGHGGDAVVAVSVLLRIAAQLVSGSVKLFEDDLNYAAAALVRQIVEIGYLAWAFESRHEDAECWLRSNRETREKFFTPGKLRKIANGKFGAKDYSFHCEFGGHPVPASNTLLTGDESIRQLLLVDLLGHAGRIWYHLVGWAERQVCGELILKHKEPMSLRLVNWWQTDPLADLGPPPPMHSPPFPPPPNPS